MNAPRTVAEAEAVCALVNRRVRLKGLQSTTGLNGEWGTVGRYKVREGRYEVTLDGSQETTPPGKPRLVKPVNLELLSEAPATPEELAVCEARNAKTLADQRKEDAEHAERVQLSHAAESAPGHNESSQASKTRRRRGLQSKICSCCDNPMELCVEEPEFIEGTEGLVGVLASTDCHSYDSEAVNDMVGGVLDAAYSGYGCVKGCDCGNWKRAPLLSYGCGKPSWFEPGGAPVGGCEHRGQNPLQHPLPRLHAAGLGEAALNVAWRDEPGTRFASVRLFMAFAACLPPPQYIYVEQFAVVFGQLHSVLSSAPGGDEVALAAAHAAKFVYGSACASRPVDFDLTFWENLIDPFEAAAASGGYREKFEGGLAPFAPSPRGASFKTFHNRRYGLDCACEACGARCKPEGPVFSVCGRCHQAVYCSPECQKRHWKPVHKAACAELALLYAASADAGWKPSARDKDMCVFCGFGPAPRADLARHVELTGHLTGLAKQLAKQGTKGAS